MATRITNSMVSDRVLADLQSRYARAGQDPDRRSPPAAASTRRPTTRVAAAQERLRQSELSGIKSSAGQRRTATQTRLTAMESSLESIRSVLSRASELALKGANGSNSQADRNAIADELDQLIKSAKDSVNAKVGNDYVFSGTKTDTAPYTTATGDTYQGDANAIVRDGGAGVQLQNNPSFTTVDGTSTPLTAGAVLGSGSASGDGKVLDALTQLSAHLRGGTAADLQAIGTTDLQAIQANQTAISSAVSAIGAMSNRATAAARPPRGPRGRHQAEDRRPHGDRPRRGHHRATPRSLPPTRPP